MPFSFARSFIEMKLSFPFCTKNFAPRKRSTHSTIFANDAAVSNILRFFIVNFIHFLQFINKNFVISYDNLNL